MNPDNHELLTRRHAIGAMAIGVGAFLSADVFASEDLVTAPGPDEYPIPASQKPALPTEFAYTFALPYAITDEYPQDHAEFERMLTLLKQSGFNTVYCPYTEWRHELFKKHDMKMMIDVLMWKGPIQNDIRREKQRDRLKEICDAVRGSDAVWGYNLWNERLDWLGTPEARDGYVRLLRTWDDTHPVWVGTYRNYHADSYQTPPGTTGWYDYHWARGLDWNFFNLSYYRDLSQKRHSAMGRWLSIDDYERDLYTLNTSIAYGLKTGMWFIGGPYASREPDYSKRWNADSHLIRLGQYLKPRFKLIGEMGPAQEVYCTPTTRTPDNKEKEYGLPKHTVGFPENFWFQVEQGEAVCGFFGHRDGSQIVYISSLKVFEPQQVAVLIDEKMLEMKTMDRFDLVTGEWQPLETASALKFDVPPADAVILRLCDV